MPYIYTLQCIKNPEAIVTSYILTDETLTDMSDDDRTSITDITRTPMGSTLHIEHNAGDVTMCSTTLTAVLEQKQENKLT